MNFFALINKINLTNEMSGILYENKLQKPDGFLLLINLLL